MAHNVDSRIAAWQASEYEVGMIRFCPSNTAAEWFPYYKLPTDATFLGLLEADALCLVADGTLLVYDHEVANRVLCRASPKQATFLATLALVEEHFEKCANDDAYSDDESAAIAVRQRCTAVAGGDMYERFVSTMVGA